MTRNGATPDDLSGQRFGRWIMLWRHEPQKPAVAGRQTPWRARCDQGHEHDVLPGPLKSGNNTRCPTCEDHKKKERSKRLEQSKQNLPRDIVYRGHVNHVRRDARNRKIEFDDSICDVFLSDIARAQNMRCIFSGERLYFRSNSKFKEGIASLDRKNSKIGYTRDNIQWTTKKINRMKGVLSDEEFIAICCAIADHQRAKKKG